MLLGTLGAGLLGSLLTGKGKIRAGKGTVKLKKILMLYHPLTYFEIQKYYQNDQIQKFYQNEPKFKGV